MQTVSQQTSSYPPSDDPSLHSSDEEEPDNFNSLFSSFSKQWVNAQLTHKVSLAAANSFWGLSFKYLKDIFHLKNTEGIKKKIPQFIQVRKNIYKDLCPDVKMIFVFLNKTDNTIIRVEEDKTPLNEYERDPKYQKLYEEARIEVNIDGYY